jgi:hypothetical protein
MWWAHADIGDVRKEREIVAKKDSCRGYQSSGVHSSQKQKRFGDCPSMYLVSAMDQHVTVGFCTKKNRTHICMESLVLVLMHKHRLVQESSVSGKFACWWMRSPYMIFFSKCEIFFFQDQFSS